MEKFSNKSVSEQYNLVNGKNDPFKSAAKVAFAQYWDIAQKVGSLRPKLLRILKK